MPGLLLRLAVIALVGYIVWSILRPRYAVRIVVDEEGIRHHCGLAKGHEEKVLGFVRQHVRPEGTVSICVSRKPNGHLRVDIRGRIDPGTRQRIRNFLCTVM